MRGLATRFGLTVANDNAPGQLVLSGALDAILAAEDRARDDTGARARRLDVAGAFHSPLMAPAAERLAAALDRDAVRAAEPARLRQRHRRAVHRPAPPAGRAPAAARPLARDAAGAARPPGSSASPSSARAPCSRGWSSARWASAASSATRWPLSGDGHVRAGLQGVGEALPARRVTNDDWSQRLDTSDEWIVRRTGIRARHWLDGDETLSLLASDACTAALADAGLDAVGGRPGRLLDVHAGQGHARAGPEVAARDRRATGAAAVDVNAACAGFLFGLDHAAALVETGRARVVLVCGAEALSRVTDVRRPRHRRSCSATAPARSSSPAASRRRSARRTSSWAPTGARPTCSTPTADERVLRMRGPRGLPPRGRAHDRGDASGARGARG